MFQLQLNHSLVKVRGNNNVTLTAKLPPSGVFKKALNCFLYCKQKQRGKISTKHQIISMVNSCHSHNTKQINSIKPTNCSGMIHHPNHPEHLIENKWRKMNWIEISLLRKETSLFKKHVLQCVGFKWLVPVLLHLIYDISNNQDSRI